MTQTSKTAPEIKAVPETMTAAFEDFMQAFEAFKETNEIRLGEIEQTIFANEAQRADVHLPAVTLQTVGPTLIRYGTQKQKDNKLTSCETSEFTNKAGQTGYKCTCTDRKVTLNPGVDPGLKQVESATKAMAPKN